MKQTRFIAVIVAALLGSTLGSPALAQPVPPPAALPTTQSAALPLEVSGAAYAEFDARAGVWILRGAPVVITRGPTRLEAAEIRYAERSGIAVASGGVVMRHETITLRAAEAEGRLREQYVSARGEVVLTERRADGEARLTAGRVEAYLGERRIEATGRALLTHREARLAGERITYDWAAQTAAVTGGELVLPEGRVSAERITANLAGETVEALGAVRLSSEDLVATAPRARLDRTGGTALLTGGVIVRRGADTLSAESVTIDLRTRRAVATGAPRLVIGAPAGN